MPAMISSFFKNLNIIRWELVVLVEIWRFRNSHYEFYMYVNSAENLIETYKELSEIFEMLRSEFFGKKNILKRMKKENKFHIIPIAIYIMCMHIFSVAMK